MGLQLKGITFASHSLGQWLPANLLETQGRNCSLQGHHLGPFSFPIMRMRAVIKLLGCWANWLHQDRGLCSLQRLCSSLATTGLGLCSLPNRQAGK